MDGHHIRALRTLSWAVDRVYKRHITVNATGAVAAVLGEIGIPQSIMRGIAVISRAADLVGHIREEQLSPSAMHLWDVALQEIPYDG